MRFDDLTETDAENMEFGLRLVVRLRWEHMIKASRDKLSPGQAYCNRKYAESLETYEKIIGRKATFK